MGRKTKESRAGISILEVVIILAILALVAVVAIPGYRRTALKEEAAELRRDLETVHNAVTKAAEINDWESGKKLSFANYQIYIVGAKRLRDSGKGVSGRIFEEQVVGVPPTATEEDIFRFRTVVDQAYWEPFAPGSLEK